MLLVKEFGNLKVWFIKRTDLQLNEQTLIWNGGYMANGIKRMALV
jgi:hypothetical protein